MPLQRPGALLAGARRQGPASFPVPTRVLDQTIGVLKHAMQQAKLGNDERMQAIARLDAQARQLEATASGPSVDEYIAQERRDSHRYGGRSVFGWEAPPASAPAQPDEVAPKARRAR